MKKGLTQTCYGFFSTLANPTRLAILEALESGPSSVTSLAKALDQEQSMISHNLSPLVRCAFVYVSRSGKERIYSLNKDTVTSLFKTVENHAEMYCPMKGDCEHSGRVRTGMRKEVD